MIEKSMQRPNCIIYSCSQGGNTLRQVLEEELRMSSRFMSRLKKTKGIYVNGKFEKFDYVLSKADDVKVLMEEEESGFEPENINVEVKYEDFDLLIIDKPAFMVVHPTKSHAKGTLANAAASYFKSKDEKIRVRFVNRLDMNTSGLVMIAKNPYAHHMVSEDMKYGNVKKKYKALVKGVVDRDEGTIDVPIYRPTEDSIMRIADERGQRAVSRFRVLERYKEATLVEVEIETGRTHQIRVHMKHIGHPILGDELYGEKDDSLIKRQALHAFNLEFRQPRTGEVQNIESQIPDDMMRLIFELKKRD